MPIGRLERVELRQIWPHEERDFSVWLENNIEALSEVLGIDLSVVQREKSVGSFELDLLAEDATGNIVIIENQLGPSDHDHLGKLVTYLTNLEAKTAVWIVANARPEHARVVSWLNEATPADVSFYLVSVEGYRIGDSEPAPLFTVISGPSRDSKDVGTKKKDLAERHVLRLRFWEQLLARAREKGITLHANRAPCTDNYIGAGAGISGVSFNYVVWLEGETAAELYIDTGDKEKNKCIFDSLLREKEKIETDFGSSLLWERLDNVRASRIRHLMTLGGLKDGEDRWPVIQDAMIDAMDRLSRALKPHIRAMRE